ncbi:DUF488 domain-containing protein [Desulfosediminicola ganghwensis]|uniref:DUF488 domain-containing protein n=1 Tax=Desulfosediminicola ganghwensis TaxID=2569540 RepID=UPI0010AD1772|nr:DUF488 family protein [Desulfosediminicola ganghwensis]
MSIRIVRLGSDRAGNEGIRIGTVRRPPRGIPKAEFSSGNWYDVWLPNLSPSPETMKMGRSATTEKEWLAFKKKYLAEMAQADKIRVIEMLAVMSHNSNFSVGCYCENEARCHRSILRDLLLQYGAEIEG